MSTKDERPRPVQAVSQWYALMERAALYQSQYAAAEVAAWLCAPSPVGFTEDRKRNADQARRAAAYLIEVAEHLEQMALRVVE